MAVSTKAATLTGSDSWAALRATTCSRWSSQASDAAAWESIGSSVAVALQ